MQSQTEAVKIKQKKKNSVSPQWKNLHMTGKKKKQSSHWMDGSVIRCFLSVLSLVPLVNGFLHFPHIALLSTLTAKIAQVFLYTPRVCRLSFVFCLFDAFKSPKLTI